VFKLRIVYSHKASFILIFYQKLQNVFKKFITNYPLSWNLRNFRTFKFTKVADKTLLSLGLLENQLLINKMSTF